MKIGFNRMTLCGADTTGSRPDQHFVMGGECITHSTFISLGFVQGLITISDRCSGNYFGPTPSSSYGHSIPPASPFVQTPFPPFPSIRPLSHGPFRVWYVVSNNSRPAAKPSYATTHGCEIQRFLRGRGISDHAVTRRMSRRLQAKPTFGCLVNRPPRCSISPLRIVGFKLRQALLRVL